MANYYSCATVNLKIGGHEGARPTRDITGLALKYSTHIVRNCSRISLNVLILIQQ